MAAFHDLWFENVPLYSILFTLWNLLLNMKVVKSPKAEKLYYILKGRRRKHEHVFPLSKYVFNNKNVEIKLNLLSFSHSRDYITSLDFSTPLQTIVYNSMLAPE